MQLQGPEEQGLEAAYPARPSMRGAHNHTVMQDEFRVVAIGQVASM